LIYGYSCAYDFFDAAVTNIKTVLAETRKPVWNVIEPGRQLLAKYCLKLFIKGRLNNRQIVNRLNNALSRLDDNYTLEIVDILEDPESADLEHVIAVPTLIRYKPLPVRRLIGDLSDPKIVLKYILDHKELSRGLIVLR
jgi:circadian clock protein KaiB